MPRQKVLIVCGTRPEVIKLGPVYKALRTRDDFQVRLCLSGQHLELAAPFLPVFGMKPSYELRVMSPDQKLDHLAARVITGMGNVVDAWKPDWVIGQGDTTTALCAALVAFYRGIKFAHVEAGLRTYDRFRPYPEEANRRMIAALSSLQFAPTVIAQKNLLREGFPREEVVVTGNTIVDALELLLRDKRLATASQRWLKQHLPSGGRIVLITAHRRENFGEGLDRICTAIRDLARRFPDVTFAYPVHLNPRVSHAVHEALGGLTNVRLLPPLDYGRFLHLLARAHVILTDSGGVQEEAPSLRKPVLVMREKTERPEGVKAGCARLVGTDTRRIIRETSRLLTDARAFARMVGITNPYGDGRASLRIADALANKER